MYRPRPDGRRPKLQYGQHGRGHPKGIDRWLCNGTLMLFVLESKSEPANFAAQVLWTLLLSGNDRASLSSSPSSLDEYQLSLLSNNLSTDLEIKNRYLEFFSIKLTA